MVHLSVVFRHPVPVRAVPMLHYLQNKNSFSGNEDGMRYLITPGKLNRQADETSNRIDLCLVTSRVDYAVPFDVNASLPRAAWMTLRS